MAWVKPGPTSSAGIILEAPQWPVCPQSQAGYCHRSLLSTPRLRKLPWLSAAYCREFWVFSSAFKALCISLLNFLGSLPVLFSVWEFLATGLGYPQFSKPPGLASLHTFPPLLPSVGNDLIVILIWKSYAHFFPPVFSSVIVVYTSQGGSED